MDNPEKLTTQVTQDEEKQNKNPTQYVLDTTICKQTQTRQTRQDPPTNKHKQGNQDMSPPTNKHKQGKQDMILLQTNTNKAIKT
jgi:hypothetical protein